MPTETSGYIRQDAYASAADKGSGMSGSGTLADPYDCLQEGLLAMAAFAAGDLAVTKTGFGNYNITFQGGHANTDVDVLLPEGVDLTGITPTATITTPIEGSASNNEVQHLALNGINEIGKFRITWEGETSGWILQSAFANATAKGSAMAGDGSYLNPYDCVQEALEQMTNFAPGDIAVAQTYVLFPFPTIRFDFTFQGTYLGLDVGSMSIQPGHSILWTSGAVATFSTTQPGGGGTDEIQRLSLSGVSTSTPTIGAFRLSWTTNPLRLTEAGLAMRWMRRTLENQTALMADVGNHLYQRDLPSSLAPAPPNHAIIYALNSNRDVAEIAGNRLFTSALLDVYVLAKEREPSAKTDRLARDLTDLLECYGPVTEPEGIVGSCVRYGQVWVQETDDVGLDWTRLGITVEVNVERVP